MTFEEQLHTAFETATVRLRDGIARELRLVAADVLATARREREAAGKEVSRDGASDDLVASARLTDAIRRLDRAGSLSETLDTLVTCAAGEALRIGLLLTGRGTVRGWRFVGFSPRVEAASAISFPLVEGGLIAEAVRTGSAVSTDDASGRLSSPPFAVLPPGRESLAVPVMMSGEVVAVLYADQGSGDTPQSGAAPTWPDAIEVMARHAARCLEALTALKAVRVLSERPELEGRTSEVVRQQ
jgi:GAF domain-containing protein